MPPLWGFRAVASNAYLLRHITDSFQTTTFTVSALILLLFVASVCVCVLCVLADLQHKVTVSMTIAVVVVPAVIESK